MSAQRLSIAQVVGQCLAYATFIGAIGWLASGPTYRHLGEGQATIKLSIRHAGQLIGDCRDRTAEELGVLAENMRAPQVCPRERSPLRLELLLNGESVFAETLPPRGLHNDGRASAYRRLSVPAGPMTVAVKLKDDVRVEGYQFVRTAEVDLLPAQVLVIDFDAEAGQFQLSTADRLEGHAG